MSQPPSPKKNPVAEILGGLALLIGLFVFFGVRANGGALPPGGLVGPVGAALVVGAMIAIAYGLLYAFAYGDETKAAPEREPDPRPTKNRVFKER